MKHILITGANSYIGMSFENYVKQWPDEYQVDTLDLVGDKWQEYDFSGYDVVFHVAGIAHADVGNVSKERIQQYYDVNTTLAINTANKAKSAGVKQFIFMSSIIVYGDSAPLGVQKVITKNTPVNPSNFYGDSKVKAEEGLQKLNDEDFRVCILRPPMIYGKNSKGNYPVLAKLACKLPIFPKVSNSRSMIYVGNFIEFVRLMIDNEERGVFFPQNAEYSDTSQIVKYIAKAHSRNVYLVPGFAWFLKLMRYCTGLLDKAFGNLVYDMSMSDYKVSYRKYSLRESIERTETE